MSSSSSSPCLHPFPPQSFGVWSVCGRAIRHPAAVPGVGPGEGGVRGHELPRSLPGAERPDPQRTNHLQQVSQLHHRAVRRHYSALREPGEKRGNTRPGRVSHGFSFK